MSGIMERHGAGLRLAVALTMLVASGSLFTCLADRGRGGSGSGNSGSGSGNSGSSHSGTSNSGPGSNNSGPGNAGDDAGRVRVEARTEAFVEGFEAELRVRIERREDRTRFKVEVENLNLPAGTTLNVCLRGQSLGTITLGADHEGELEVDSRDGQAIPAINPGDVIEVRPDACSAPTDPLLSVRIGGGTPPPAAGVPRTRLEGRAEQAFMGFEAELHVNFEMRPDRARFSAEVENVNLPPGALLNVCLRGQSLGLISLDMFHAGDLNLDSRNGDAIPTVSPGDTVEVRQGGCSASSMLVLAATVR